MIRIRKSNETPGSLRSSNCKKYDSEDVKEVLYSDHDGKCYLCEQATGKSFEIEHLRAKAKYPEFEFKWNNLFLACPYCNGRKPNQLDKFFDPCTNNIEDLIEQRILFAENKIEFKGNQNSNASIQTISLLERLLNGKSGIRDFKGQLLYKDIEREIVFFMELLLAYKSDSRDINKQAVIDSINLRKEFLGFKYWIIRDDVDLFDVFKDYISWNKGN